MVDVAVRVLEDKSTLLHVPLPKNSVIAPKATLVTLYAIQPSKDFENAAQTLFRAADQPGVQIIRSVYSVQPQRSRKKPPPQYLALHMLVRVTYEFNILAKGLLPYFLKEARKGFAQRRNTTFSILEASGCKVTLVQGKDLIQAYLFQKRIPAGITVFKDQKGFHSKFIDPFLRLDRVPSRRIHGFHAPELPVTHQLGVRFENAARPVGFPHIPEGLVLVAGTQETEYLPVLHQLFGSLIENGNYSNVFILDTKNEFNGLAKYFHQYSEKLRDRHLQVLRLGTNIHLNICDVFIPELPEVESEQAKEARAAFKADLIGEIITSALQMKEYMTSRFSMPLKIHVKRTAKINSSFTLKDVKLDISHRSSDTVDTSGVESLFADITALEQLSGILEQFRAFPEINYQHFLTHFGKYLTPTKTVTVFQLGNQPPMIARAVVTYLLHFLSQTMAGGAVLLTHADEYLSRWGTGGLKSHTTPQLLVNSCKQLSRNNALVYGSQGVQGLQTAMGFFEEIEHAVYLRLTNKKDRETILSHHQLALSHTRSHGIDQQILDISAGEGLLFRKDAPENAAYHFSWQNDYLLDLQPIQLPIAKQRGSKTLGLIPTHFAILMTILKQLSHTARAKTEMMALINDTAGQQAEILAEKLAPLGLYHENVQEGITLWELSIKGHEFYEEQDEFIQQLPRPMDINKIPRVLESLKQLESFSDSGASVKEREKTNMDVKILLGSVLNLVCQLRHSTPWVRVAEYRDLDQITGLEWQDFRNLFDHAYELANNLLLEAKKLDWGGSAGSVIRQDNDIHSEVELPTLDVHLPDIRTQFLQQLSRELGFAAYPQTGILDLYHALQKLGRSLFDELAQLRDPTNK